MNTAVADLHRVIDHTILKPDARREGGVLELCREAVEHRFASVCVNPRWVPTVAGALAGSGVATCSVIGFPLGAIPTAVKAQEAAWVVAAGATEVDMVIDIGALKDGNTDAVRADIAAVKQACGPALLKVIIETPAFSPTPRRSPPVACPCKPEPTSSRPPPASRPAAPPPPTSH